MRKRKSLILAKMTTALAILPTALLLHLKHYKLQITSSFVEGIRGVDIQILLFSYMIKDVIAKYMIK
ncbi:MAG: hypothetical protein QXZ41_07925 [Ignisphaera sp.]